MMIEIMTLRTVAPVLQFPVASIILCKGFSCEDIPAVALISEDLDNPVRGPLDIAQIGSPFKGDKA